MNHKRAKHLSVLLLNETVLRHITAAISFLSDEIPYNGLLDFSLNLKEKQDTRFQTEMKDLDDFRII
jgi:hypothetical protein